MNPNQIKPQASPEPKPSVPLPEVKIPAQPVVQNPQVPPAPATQKQPVASVSPLPDQNELPQNNPTVVDEQIASKKSQAKKLLIAAGVFVSIFVLGVIAVVVIVLGNEETESKLTTNEQIAADVNTLGLGIINYTNNRKTDFSLESEQVGELKVSYLPIEFSDPRTDMPYTITTEIPSEGELQYVVGGVCNEDDSISQSGKGENFAIRALLENGTLYCIQRSEVEAPKTPNP